MAKALAHPEIVSLAAGFVDQETLPVSITQDALASIWASAERSRATLQYGSTIGFPPLREAVLDRMTHADGGSRAEFGLQTDQVVITAGSNQILFLLSDILLDPGDILLCGQPSYYVFLGTVANLGAQAVGVATDAEGLIPEALNERLQQLATRGELERVKALYLTSYFDNPTGVTLSVKRREEILEIVYRWSRKAKIYLIDDVAYRELRYYGDDVPGFRAIDSAGDTVVTVGSFSKTYSPGIRVGWGILPRSLVQPVLSLKGNIDFGSPNFNQLLMASLIEQGWYDEHLAKLLVCYREKIDATLEAADRHLTPLGSVDWVRPTGGLYVWLRLPESMDTGPAGPLFERAVEEGVLYVPGECCYPDGGDPIPKNMLRLSFGVPSCDAIRRGIEAIARALREVMR
jgi:2-aminoadipate transaminase